MWQWLRRSNVKRDGGNQLKFSEGALPQSVQSLSCVWLSAPGFPVHHQLPEPTQTHLHHVGDAIQPSHPLLSPFPPVFSLSQHQGLFPVSWFFTSGGQRIGVSASTSVLPMNIQGWFSLGWIWLEIWLDLLAVQRTLKSLLQHHSSKAPILQCSAFFIDKLSHPYMTTGKTIALTRWIFVSKVMSLLCNTLSRFVIAFVPRSKRLLISQLQLSWFWMIIINVAVV